MGEPSAAENLQPPGAPLDHRESGLALTIDYRLDTFDMTVGPGRCPSPLDH